MSEAGNSRQGPLHPILTPKSADTAIETFAPAYDLVVSSDKLSANGSSSSTSRLFVTTAARISWFSSRSIIPQQKRDEDDSG